MQQQQAQFAARIARIKDPRNVSYTDPETGMIIPKRMVKQKKGALQGGLYPVSILLAALLGMVGVLVSRYVRFHFLGMTDTDGNPDITMILDMAMGAAAAFALKELFRVSGKLAGMAQTAGIVAMVLVMHNFVWMFPDLFATVFSDGWVDMVTSSTRPNSIFFRGASFTL